MMSSSNILRPRLDDVHVTVGNRMRMTRGKPLFFSWALFLRTIFEEGEHRVAIPPLISYYQSLRTRSLQCFRTECCSTTRMPFWARRFPSSNHFMNFWNEPFIIGRVPNRTSNRSARLTRPHYPPLSIRIPRFLKSPGGGGSIGSRRPGGGLFPRRPRSAPPAQRLQSDIPAKRRRGTRFHRGDTGCERRLLDRRWVGCGILWGDGFAFPSPHPR